MSLTTISVSLKRVLHYSYKKISLKIRIPSFETNNIHVLEMAKIQLALIENNVKIIFIDECSVNYPSIKKYNWTLKGSEGNILVFPRGHSVHMGIATTLDKPVNIEIH